MRRSRYGDGHFAAIAELTRRHPRLIGAELLAHHDLGASKADRIGIGMDYVKYRSPDLGAFDARKDRVRAYGGRVLNRDRGLDKDRVLNRGRVLDKGRVFDGDRKALGEGGVV